MDSNLDPNAKETPGTKETTFQERFKLFVGFDWASDHHDAVGVIASGKVVLKMRFEDSAEGWASFRQGLVELAGTDLSKVAVSVETCNGPAVERLLQANVVVYPLNPKAAERYRDRKSPMGDKNDPLDAWSFADALRTDGQGWKPLLPDDPITQELRILCRDEVQLIHQRTALVCQLRAALREYYPAALEAFEDWTVPSPWAFVEAFPTPAILVKAGKRRWEKFLHVHKLYRPETYAKRMEIFARADRFAGTPPVTSAKSRLAMAGVAQLRTLQKQLEQYRQAIEQLFERHPDNDIFGSLPGAGGKLAPRILSELGDRRERFQDAQELQCYAGSAPVTKQSGKKKWVIFRTGCNKHLRQAVHLWANLSREKSTWADVYYRHKRDRGMSHACALRCLAQRWLKIIWKMWQDHTTYDEAFHTRNQIEHGSWVIQPA
jgi:transposase